MACGGQCLFVHAMDDGVQHGIQTFDLAQRPFDDFHHIELLLAQECRDGDGVVLAEIE